MRAQINKIRNGKEEITMETEMKRNYNGPHRREDHRIVLQETTVHANKMDKKKWTNSYKH